MDGRPAFPFGQPASTWRSAGLPRPATDSRSDSIVRSILRCIPRRRSWLRDGVAVVHVMKYLGDDATDVVPDRLEEELESFLDQLPPGWRAHVVARRFLPGMTVAHGLPLAESTVCEAGPGGIRERRNIFLAGDWVGPEGMLADASAASAAESARSRAGRAQSAPRR